MNASQNPYTPMLVTFHPERFFGRSSQVINILQVITAADPNGHAIYGIRTIGKTTLLRYIKDEHGAIHHHTDYVSAPYRPGGGQHLIFVYVNFHRFSSNDGTIFHKMLDELCEELLDDPHIGPQLDLPQVEHTTDRIDIIAHLRRLLNRLNNQHQTRVVFLLDDFDVPLIKKHVDSDDDGLLRTLCDDAALIIATDEPISFIRPDINETSPLLGILRPDGISLLRDNEARELIHKPAKDIGFHVSEAEASFLIRIGGLQPFPLIAACELYFNMRQEYSDISSMLQHEQDQQRLQEQFIFRLAGLHHVKSVLEMTWEKLSPEERHTTTQIANGMAINLNGDTSHIRDLMNKSLVYNDLKYGEYRLYSELFAYFVRAKNEQAKGLDAPAPQVASLAPRQLMLALSPIDSALLEYFLEHQERICTFDELLDAVWDDEEDKSKRALEASVYRLRRALGKSGTIKNVRGKGYKFLAGQAVSDGSL